jgi:hypothetical protein
MSPQTDARPSFSFELFPPKTPEAMEKLKTAIRALNAAGPEYFSVTYGAGGSTRERTFETVAWLVGQGIDTAPHLACIGSERDEVRGILRDYRERGIRRIVALRGDLPSGMGVGASGDFRYANELVDFIRAEHGGHFHIEVAAYPEYHPQAPNPIKDLENFRRKVEAGPTPPSPNTFITPTPISALWTRAAPKAWRSPSSPASCPSPTSPSWLASRTPAGRRSPVGYAAAWRATETTWNRSESWDTRWYCGCAAICSRAGRRGCTSTP